MILRVSDRIFVSALSQFYEIVFFVVFENLFHTRLGIESYRPDLSF